MRPATKRITMQWPLPSGRCEHLDQARVARREPARASVSKAVRAVASFQARVRYLTATRPVRRRGAGGIEQHAVPDAAGRAGAELAVEL